MPTLIDLRRRIKSVRNSQQITQAMKTVATAKFRKVQRTVIEARPYWHLLPDLMREMALWAVETGHPLLSRRDEKKAEILVVTSDKGLAGAFNSNLLEKAQAFLLEKEKSAALRLVLIGKKAVNALKKLPYPVDWLRSEDTDKLGRTETKDLAEFLMRQYAFQKCDAVYIIYNEFKSILSPRIMTLKILPLEPENGEGWPPQWEPEAEELVRFLLPLYVESQIHHALFESQAAEHAARMMAMDNATKNAGELIDDLTLVLNKIRQAGITKELLEIMTAVEALKHDA